MNAGPKENLSRLEVGDRVLCHANLEPGVVVEVRDVLRGEQTYYVRLDVGRETLMLRSRMRKVAGP